MGITTSSPTRASQADMRMTAEAAAFATASLTASVMLAYSQTWPYAPAMALATIWITTMKGRAANKWSQKTCTSPTRGSSILRASAVE